MTSGIIRPKSEELEGLFLKRCHEQWSIGAQSHGLHGGWTLRCPKSRVSLWEIQGSRFDQGFNTITHRIHNTWYIYTDMYIYIYVYYIYIHWHIVNIHTSMFLFQLDLMISCYFMLFHENFSALLLRPNCSGCHFVTCETAHKVQCEKVTEELTWSSVDIALPLQHKQCGLSNGLRWLARLPWSSMHSKIC